MSIPKKIHQIYWDFSQENKPPRPQWQEWSKLLQEKNPHFEYKCWNKEDCDQLIQTHFPEHYPIYKRCWDIIQTDFARLVIVYVEGGIYSDMDIECYRSFDPLCELENVHTLLFTDGSYKKTVVSNGFLAGQVGSPFLLILIQRSLDQMKKSIGKSVSGGERMVFIIDCVGPGFLTETVRNIFHQLYICRLNVITCQGNITEQYTKYIQDGVLIFPPQTILGYDPSNFGRIFGRHFTHGSWR